MFSLETINKIVQSGNIAHPLTFRICPFEWFQSAYSNDTRNERTNYTNETQMNANEKRTNDTRKRNERKMQTIRNIC